MDCVLLLGITIEWIISLSLVHEQMDIFLCRVDSPRAHRKGKGQRIA